MTTPLEDGDRQIREALLGVEALIAERVRLEQQHCPLTRLPNLVALKEALSACFGQPKLSYWVAFVEVDKFKSVNDRFGHENANALLKSIATMMSTMCSIFPGRTTAYRAHGDEFYFVGYAETEWAADWPTGILQSLELVRQSIGAIKINVKDKGLMSGTVSTGWLTNHDVMTATDSLVTDRFLLNALELACQQAKRDGRNNVVRYSTKLSDEPWLSLRGDCTKCDCRFSYDVKTKENRAEVALVCPNCRSEVLRPVAPTTGTPAPEII